MTNTTKITTVAIRVIQLVEVGRDIYEATVVILVVFVIIYTFPYYTVLASSHSVFN
jgi:hypothetical protein